MYLILFDADDNETSSRASEVFHNGVDVTRLRAAKEEKVPWTREGPSKNFKRSDGEGPTKKVYQRRSLKEGLGEDGCRNSSHH